MKLNRLLKHGIVITIGLAIGLIVRAAMKPDQVSPIKTSVPPKATTISPSNSRSVSLGSLSEILNLLDRGERIAQTPEEECFLKSSIFDLKTEDLKKLAEEIRILDLPERSQVNIALFTAWGEVAPLEALAAIAQLPHHLQRLAEMSVMEAWVLVDADAAFAHVHKENPPLPSGERFSPNDPDSRLWHRLAKVDPAQALSRAAEIGNPKKRRKTENEIIRLMSYTDAPAALDWIAEHREGKNLKNIMVQVIDGWATYQPREALTHLLHLPKELQSDHAYRQLGTSMDRNVEMALEMVDEIPDSYQNAFTKGLVEIASRYEPSRSAKIGQSMPEGRDKQEAYKELASNWSTTDPVAAAEWLATLPRTRSRDWAIKGFAKRLLPHDPETAVTWLTDMDHKDSAALHNSLLNWLGRNRTAARAWIELQPPERLSEKQKRKILGSFKK